MTDPCGVILYDKPPGPSSHDVVAGVRRRWGRAVKVGHAGTLDPFASGLLLVLVGRATRAQRFLMALPKHYEVTARFGATSSTGDPEGEIVETGVVPTGTIEAPTGRVRQRPPAYSAVKVGGQRAYRLARAGHEPLELPERVAEVDDPLRVRVGHAEIADLRPAKLLAVGVSQRRDQAPDVRAGRALDGKPPPVALAP